jgi:hypothetical protein
MKMANYHDDSWLKTNRWGDWGPNDEVGTLNDVTPEMILKAISLIKKGKVYDLETERFKGMPVWPGHCGFDILSYSNPQGRRNLKDTECPVAFNWNKEGGMLSEEKNAYNMGLNTEMVVTPLHLGTHIDALCHWTTGEDDHWYKRLHSDKYCTVFGPPRRISPRSAHDHARRAFGHRGL